jgi:hypothetical protein
MKTITKRIIIASILSISVSGNAQENGKIFFTTSFGLINAQGKFGNAFKSALAFNSGVELSMKRNWFGQLVFEFNALQYDQQIKDNNSPFLFHNTNSSLLLLGLNGGRNLPFKYPEWFISLYGGGGYLNIGEPRVTVDLATNIARQNVRREGNIFGRAGSRLAYKTKSNFFQTLYFDAFYWFSPAKVQEG